jgi:hypothetical protein
LYSTPRAILEKPAAALSAAALSIFAKDVQPADLRKGGHYKATVPGRHLLSGVCKTCGSELARDEDFTFNINVAWYSAIASKLAPTASMAAVIVMQGVL